MTVITKYEGGTSRKAYAVFATCPPERGSHYVIGHEHGTALGYKVILCNCSEFKSLRCIVCVYIYLLLQVSSMGYAAPTATPKRRDGFGNPLYGQQMTALSHARAVYGGLPPNELAKDGIGRPERVRSVAQDLNALNAGMLVRREFRSGDIFEGSLVKAEVTHDPLKEAQNRVREEYFNDVQTRSQVLSRPARNPKIKFCFTKFGFVSSEVKFFTFETNLSPVSSIINVLHNAGRRRSSDWTSG